MNDNVENMVKRLNFENFIWVCFIVISIFDIYGDELIKKELRSNDKTAAKKANKVFLRVTAFSVLIYIYFLLRNYDDYKKHHTKSYEIRLMGSIFILFGTLCLLYFQYTNKKDIDSPSNI